MNPQQPPHDLLLLWYLFHKKAPIPLSSLHLSEEILQLPAFPPVTNDEVPSSFLLRSSSSSKEVSAHRNLLCSLALGIGPTMSLVACP